ncbi:MAG: UDP-4-amino-4,6-dideoxy-N-acetyl-beta-L-altrosamine N-acetyltransferase [Candidatus Saccharibacteria bacterium]|nr:UDP-4-amino-4,6-dideoxy-N-acetyl-beta-L-altrosamine N-acetyltransferase [Rhodoferax sp.]
MTRDDLSHVLAWRNHSQVRSHMFTQHKIGVEEHQRWFDRAAKDPLKHLLIYESECYPLGFINFVVLGNGGVVEWGFYASPDAPKGSGGNLGRLALEYAFNHLDFYKVFSQVLEDNERSIRMHQRLGFQQEGVLRDQHFDGEQYHHVVCFGLLRSEWPLGNRLE